MESRKDWACPSTRGIYLSWKGFVVDCRHGIHLSCFCAGNLAYLAQADLRVVLKWILGGLIAADTLQAMCAVFDTCKIVGCQTSCRQRGDIDVDSRKGQSSHCPQSNGL